MLGGAPPPTKKQHDQDTWDILHSNTTLLALLSFSLAFIPKFLYIDLDSTEEQLPEIKEEFFGARRKLRIGVLGAGITCLQFLHDIEEKIPKDSVEIVVFEREKDVGGMWLTHTYPGWVTYQFNWRPYVPSEWYPRQAEILQYLQTVARECGFYRYMRFKHEILQASWRDDESKWTLQAKDLANGKIYEEPFDLFLDLTGSVTKPLSPQITVPGIEVFKGMVLQPSNWPDNIELTGKRVALLGYGASGVQLAPSTIDEVDQLYTWFRHKIYTMPPPQSDFSGGGGLNFEYSDEQKSLLKDPDVLRTYINKVEEASHARWQAYINGSEMSVKGTEAVLTFMRTKLAPKPGLYQQIAAKDFDILCRRPEFSHGYLETLASPKTIVLPSPPQHSTSKGFVDTDGTEHNIDIIIAATGYDQRGLPGYPQIVNGINMNTILAQNSSSRVYLSIMREDIPNFSNIGPSYAWLYGSWTQSVMAPSAYFLKVIEKMQVENILSLKPSSKAVNHFVRH